MVIGLRASEALDQNLLPPLFGRGGLAPSSGTSDFPSRLSGADPARARNVAGRSTVPMRWGRTRPAGAPGPRTSSGTRDAAS